MQTAVLTDSSNTFQTGCNVAQAWHSFHFHRVNKTRPTNRPLTKEQGHTIQHLTWKNHWRVFFLFCSEIALNLVLLRGRMTQRILKQTGFGFQGYQPGGNIMSPAAQRGTEHVANWGVTVCYFWFLSPGLHRKSYALRTQKRCPVVSPRWPNVPIQQTQCRFTDSVA